jgi:hypothetical protein
MHPLARWRRWVASGIGLALVLLAVPVARHTLARARNRPEPHPLENRLPDGAGTRLESAMRRQALIRAEGTARMLWRLEADGPGEGR